MPDGFAAAMPAAELPPGTMKAVAIDRQRILVANVAGVHYAVRDTRGHAGAPLSSGTSSDAPSSVRRTSRATTCAPARS